MKILDGRALSKKITQEQIVTVEKLKKVGITPKLVVVMLGDDPASDIYIRNKQKRAEKIGIDSQLVKLPEQTSQETLLKLIAKLNQDQSVDGILVQLPLPQHIDEQLIIEAVNPQKDVDGFSPINMGKLWSNQANLVACTPKGIMTMLAENQITVAQKNVVIVGRSNIVGRPIAALMLNANATVTITHSQTKNLAAITKQADILVVAIGQGNFIDESYVKTDAVVIDVGMNRLADGQLVGDVNFERVKEKAAAITPVPGGVGPMTITTLMAQTIEIARRRLQNGTNQ